MHDICARRYCKESSENDSCQIIKWLNEDVAARQVWAKLNIPLGFLPQLVAKIRTFPEGHKEVC
ncbi:MAG: hypothetical protein Q8T09_13595 [Candidatus Melainabacteria bacterium]|nr:hypothetical protein [Candidatus Melainabacteria bacterium]